jgi:hypothetical protein
MEFAGGHLFHKKPEDMRGVGALGGRTRARNLRLHKAREVPVTREISRPREETAGEAILRIDVSARPRGDFLNNQCWSDCNFFGIRCTFCLSDFAYKGRRAT